MLGTYEKRKRKVLTKSRTSPDPSEERRVSLGEFGETKDFGTGIKADQHFSSALFSDLHLSNEGDLFLPQHKEEFAVMPKARVHFEAVACKTCYVTELNHIYSQKYVFWHCVASFLKTKVSIVDIVISRMLTNHRFSR